ncbi:MAG: nucleotide exchange factor GrpE [Christensenellales bacterium]|nr:nucleotide exchange factor GrpE [Clostridiales bacterium]MDY5677402.1 nucleotide exchange factor GrpE [Eubacteriales bacterium]MDY5726183.1 nucleotide exchange factor GrpE [Eubacteriales bacterium]
MADNQEKKVNENQEKTEQPIKPQWTIDSVPDEELREFAKSVIDSLKEENEQLMTEQEELKKQIKKSDEYLNQLVVLKSDFENYRRRTSASAEASKSDGRLEVVEKVFPILDTFDKARQMLSEKEMEPFELIAKQFDTILRQIGVEKMEVLGTEFDPKTSNAVHKLSVDDETKDNVVLEEYAAGYVYGEKVLRYATVAVGKFEKAE